MQPKRSLRSPGLRDSSGGGSSRVPPERSKQSFRSYRRGLRVMLNVAPDVSNSTGGQCSAHGCFGSGGELEYIGISRLTTPPMQREDLVTASIQGQK